MCKDFPNICCFFFFFTTLSCTSDVNIEKDKKILECNRAYDFIEGTVQFKIYEDSTDQIGKIVRINGSEIKNKITLEYYHDGSKESYLLNACGEPDSQSPQLLKTLVSGSYHIDISNKKESKDNSDFQPPIIHWDINACQSDTSKLFDKVYTTEVCNISSNDKRYRYNLTQVNRLDESNTPLPVSDVLLYESNDSNGYFRAERIFNNN